MNTTGAVLFSVGATTQPVSFSRTAESVGGGNVSSYFDVGGGNLSYYADYADYTDYDSEDLLRHYNGNYNGRRGAYFLPALYCILFMLGVLGNLLVVWVMVAGVGLRSVTDVCLFNLAMADLLLLSSLPFLAHQARRHWSFGDGWCKAVLGTYYVGFYSGIFFLVLMSMDRYLAIVHAILALKVRTRTFGAVAAVVTWAAGLLASFPEVGFLEAQTLNGTLFCAPNIIKKGDLHYGQLFGLLKMNVLGLVLPLVIMTFCYGCIIRKLLSGRSSRRPAVRLILVVVVAFLCCWLPYNLTCFIKALYLMGIPKEISCHHSSNLRTAVQVTEVVAYSHSCLNPAVPRHHKAPRTSGGEAAELRLLPASMSTSLNERSTAV
ncbi:hypothetical protein NHX12_029995 [Muraenolepis orangiensis]|uniref:G-protein coupled receptors family 1 profile domain-containing protein n=1 Tax=Muraenolepis orangiensis TaxID=630683 RepID=A0A9Q0EAE7_9TELE|nr:hypothetical protein NHX12_029995 [Muraenolepis orangiensis]